MDKSVQPRTDREAVKDLVDFLADTDTERPGYAMDLAEKIRVVRKAMRL